MTLLNEVASCKAVVFRFRLHHSDFDWKSYMSRLYEALEFFDCWHVPLRITENSAALLIGDFVEQFKSVGCDWCGFNCVLRFHNGKAEFYITDLKLSCDYHVRLFTETITTSTSSRSTNLCLKQSCLKFLRHLGCCRIGIAQTFKDLGAVIRNCKHLATIKSDICGLGICELLDQIPRSSSCSLSIGCYNALVRTKLRFSSRGHILTSVEAEKLAGVLPRFNVTVLYLELVDCCAAAVNKLVCSITHKTLQVLILLGLSLTSTAAAALGRSLPEMSSLRILDVTGTCGSTLQAEEMEALFGGINKTFPALKELVLRNFNARGSLTPLTKRVHFFPKLVNLGLNKLNMDERDLHGLLESLTSIPNLKGLGLSLNPLGSRDTVQSAVQ